MAIPVLNYKGVAYSSSLKVVDLTPAQVRAVTLNWVLARRELLPAELPPDVRKRIGMKYTVHGRMDPVASTITCEVLQEVIHVTEMEVRGGEYMADRAVRVTRLVDRWSVESAIRLVSFLAKDDKAVENSFLADLGVLEFHQQQEDNTPFVEPSVFGAEEDEWRGVENARVVAELERLERAAAAQAELERQEAELSVLAFEQAGTW